MYYSYNACNEAWPQLFVINISISVELYGLDGYIFHLIAVFCMACPLYAVWVSSQLFIHNSVNMLSINDSLKFNLLEICNDMLSLFHIWFTFYVKN